MTAVEIIEEMKRLPPDEQSRVIEFARHAGENLQLSPEELGRLAKQRSKPRTRRRPAGCKRKSNVDFTAPNLMPKIRHLQLPQPLLVHLLTRMRQRNISSEQIILLRRTR